MIVNGTTGNDSLTGTEGADSISAFDGNDTLNGLGGIDTLNGGLGNDTYIVTAGDVLSDAGGIDTVVSDVSWTLATGFENLTMSGSGNIAATGNGADNLLIGNSGNNYFNPRSGNDTVQAGAGNDTIDMSTFGTPSFGDDVFDGGAGFDRLNYATSSPPQSALAVDLAAGTITGGGAGGVSSARVTGIEAVVAGGFNDRLSGSGAAESFDGREGNDTLSGLGGNDTLTGGLGQDLFVFAAAPGSGNVDQITDFVHATDKLSFDNAVFTAIGGSGNFVFDDPRFTSGAGLTSGRDASDRIVYDSSTGNLYYDADGNGSGASQLIVTLQGAPTMAPSDIAVTGAGGGSAIRGTAGNDSLVGTEGNDSIEGLGGNDTIAGRFGDDTLDGGEGDDDLDGEDGADLVRGGSGNDTLHNHVNDDPGVSVDTLDGGLGNDTYDLRAFALAPRAGTVIVDAGGIDTVLSDHSFVLPDGIENLSLFEGGTGTGNALDNVITTSTNEPHSYFVDGRAGNDTLIGGDDMDAMTGGAGSDVFVFLRPTHTLFSDRLEDFASGTDRLQFDNRGFTQLGAPGTFASGDARFASGAGLTSGQDASDRLIYDTLNGDLYYDADGNGAGESVLVAHLTGAPTLGATDITVIGQAAPPPPPPPGSIQGTAGNDSLTGTEGNDSIAGLAGSDTINALGGNDTLDGGTGIDTLNGGLGNDTYIVNAGDVLSDTGGVDTVVSDVNWTLGAGFENLTMAGSASIAVTGNELGNFAIGNSGNNYFNLRAGDDTIQAGAGDDRIDMSNFGTASYGNDVVDGGAGFDIVSFTTGSGQRSPVVVDLITGSATGGGEGGVGSASLTSVEGVIGSEFGDVLSGSGLAERFEGREGNDTLSGLGGNDTLAGGTGQDTFKFASTPGNGNLDLITDFLSATDKLSFSNGFLPGVGAAGDFTNGDARFAAGAGFTSARDPSDRIIYDTTTGALYYDADGSGGGPAVQVATLQGAPTLAATDITVVGQAAPPPPPSPPVTFRGTSGNDSFIGSDGDDSIEGLAGNDTLDGRGGHDTIDGGDGDDSLAGGGGGDLMRGGSGNDTLSSADFVDDGDPPDTLDGGLGDDTYDLFGVFSQFVTPVLVDAGGVDTARIQRDFTLPDGIENLELFESKSGTGNALDNVITTHTNESHHYAVDGADGNDTLVGGQDSDEMQGGRGDDRFVVLHSASPTFQTDAYDGGEGFDFVDVGGAPASGGWSVDLSGGTLDTGDDPNFIYATLANIEGVSASPFDDLILGSSVANVLQGAAGNDTLDGKGGNDTLSGGTGADAFFFTVSPGAANADLINDFASGADKIRLDARVMTNLGASGNFAADDARFFAAAGASAGHDADDRIVYNTTTRQLFYDADGNGAGSAQLIATLQAGATLAATDIAVDNGSAPPGGQVINGTAGNDSLTGTEGNDSIAGLAGNDTINALGGNDTLDGGAGIDNLNGGLGNDTYVVTAGDVLSDTGGIDTVVSDVNWTLGAGFENLTMAGSASIAVTGNELGNFAIGNSGNNYFNLRAGNDTIQAGAGDDRIDMSNFGTPSYGDDVVDGGAGFDTLSFLTGSGQKSAVVVDLAAGTARGGGEGGIGSVTFTSIEGVIGTEFADRLSGSGAAESFDGWTGNDTMDGGAGNDTMSGGDGDDSLFGGAGDDRLEGGIGSDRLNGAEGSDSFVFLRTTATAGGVDVIDLFASGSDKLLFDNAAFTALGADGSFTAGDARFVSGAGLGSARDASDRLIYDTTTGNLYYDADGTGSLSNPQQIAILFGHPAITATDITVI